MTEAQTLQHNPNIEMKEFKFRFRKDKLGNQRPTFSIKAPVPSVEGLSEIILTEGKSRELLLEVVADYVRGIALGIVNDDEKINGQTNFPVASLDWNTIANTDRSERRTIAAELWEEFAKDYAAIMPAATGKKEEAIAAAVTVYLKKFSQLKTDKKSLGVLKQQLEIYTNTTQRGEDFSEILEVLNKKLELYLTSDEAAQLAAVL